MAMMTKERISEVMQMVADDMEADVKAFEGKPFNGRTVAEFFGNQAAAIRAVALAVKQLSESVEGSGKQTQGAA